MVVYFQKVMKAREAKGDREKRKRQEEREEENMIREEREGQKRKRGESCRGTGSCWRDQQWGSVHHQYALCIMMINLLNIDMDRQSVSQLFTRLFKEQPQLHRVC